MTAIRILRAGQHTTVQDLGRHGHTHQGVPPSGAADTLSLRIGNRLVGNPDHAAALEMTLVGDHIEFTSACIVTLTGAPAACALHPAGHSSQHARPLDMWTPATLNPGDSLDIRAITDGAHAYLCISGGLDLPLTLDSRSTLTRASFGGHKGRPLRAGDILPVAAPVPQPRHPLSADSAQHLQRLLRPGLLTCTRGPHAHLFHPDALSLLTAHTHRVSTRWDRSGFLLEGHAPTPPGEGRITTEGVAPGFIQVPGNGSLLILGPDGPTTGGYPVIAAVASASLPALAQLRPGDEVRLDLVPIDEARRRFQSLEDDIQRMIPP